MVSHPRDYSWSSYRAHAYGKADPLVADHALYLSLGRTQTERQKSYRALFTKPLDRDFIRDVREATNGGWAMGGERFRAQITAALKRRAGPLPPGPKPKGDKDKRQMILL